MTLRTRSAALAVVPGVLASCVLCVWGGPAGGAGQAPAPVPRNIIVMIGDGCGYNHFAAADLYQYGVTGQQVYESFPVRLGVTTYSTSGRAGYNPHRAWRNLDYLKEGATDSAAAATALACGVKTYNGAIGVVLPEGGAAPADVRPVENILERAEKHGKATGVVTSAELSHATPAGFVAHTASRGDYVEIANQMIAQSACEVVMGCGHPLYNTGGVRRPEEELPEKAYQWLGGKGLWDQVVAGTAGADADGDGTPDPWTLAQSRADFERLSYVAPPKRLLGIPLSGTTLNQDRPGEALAAPYEVPRNQNVPTLAEMTRAALNALSADPDGFVVMIEGGAIDWAAHGGQLGRTIEEVVDFSRAVEAVTDWVSHHGGWDDTLVIVTADHETGCLTGPDTTEADPWPELVSNGPGAMPGAAWHSGGHTNSLVPVLANGTGSELLSGKAKRTDPRRGPYIDNTDIAHALFELLGSIGSGRED